MIVCRSRRSRNLSMRLVPIASMLPCIPATLERTTLPKPVGQQLIGHGPVRHWRPPRRLGRSLLDSEQHSPVNQIEQPTISPDGCGVERRSILSRRTDGTPILWTRRRRSPLLAPTATARASTSSGRFRRCRASRRAPSADDACRHAGRRRITRSGNAGGCAWSSAEHALATVATVRVSGGGMAGGGAAPTAPAERTA